MGPRVYHPCPGRLQCLTIFGFHSKSSTFSPIIWSFNHPHHPTTACTLPHDLTRWQYVCFACTYYYTIDQAMYFATDMFTFLSFPWLVNKARAFPSLTYTFSIIKSPWRDHEIHVKLNNCTSFKLIFHHFLDLLKTLKKSQHLPFQIIPSAFIVWHFLNKIHCEPTKEQI